MTNRQARQVAMLVRSDRFVQERPGLFPEGSQGSKASNTLSTVLEQIGAFNSAKQKKGREVRTTKRLAKEALRAQLLTITRSARVLAKTVPDADARFPLPVGESDMAAHQAGLLFVKESTAMKEAFIECGLPATFLETLQQSVTAFERAVASGSDARTNSVVSRKEIKALLKEGVDAVRSLDVLVANALGHDRVAMAVWKQMRHVDKIGVSSSASDTPAVVAPEPLAPETVAANAGDDPLRRAS